MIFTCTKNIKVDNIEFKENCYYCSQDNYDKIKKKLSKYNPEIPIKGNDGLIVNKKKKNKTLREAINVKSKKLQ